MNRFAASVLTGAGIVTGALVGGVAGAAASPRKKSGLTDAGMIVGGLLGGMIAGAGVSDPAKPGTTQGLGMGERISFGGFGVSGFALSGIVVGVGPGSLEKMSASVGDTIHLMPPAYDPSTNPKGSVVYAPDNTVQQIGPQDYRIIGPSTLIHVAWGDGPWGAAGHTYIDSTPPAMTVFKAGETWQIDFETSAPVSNEQFFKFVATVENAPVFANADFVSFTPIDQQHFRAIMKWRKGGAIELGKVGALQGITFTATAATLVPTDSGSDLASSPSKLSTGAIVGIAAAGATVIGGVIYAVAHGGPRRRRRR